MNIGAHIYMGVQLGTSAGHMVAFLKEPLGRVFVGFLTHIGACIYSVFSCKLGTQYEHIHGSDGCILKGPFVLARVTPARKLQRCPGTTCCSRYSLKERASMYKHK